LGFGAEPVQQERDVGLVQVGVELGTERLFEGVGPPQLAAFAFELA